MQLIMRTTTCESIFLDVVGSDTFDNVMAKMKEMAHKCCCASGPQQVRRSSLKVVGLDTFDLVKAKIDDICSVDNHDLHWELIPKPKGWWWGGMPIFVRILNGKNLHFVNPIGPENLQLAVPDHEKRRYSRGTGRSYSWPE
ncbi:hypothetical protein HanPSC8_Chr01g0010661 [Helianthus annuus]|nr:hypothetical protein HanPSC8_Chr01g0010661 [Helianthus annuus]